MDIGNLSIQIIEAELTRDIEVVGKMDPYAVFTYDGKVVLKTNVCTDQGKTPKWTNEHFEIKVID